MLSVVTYALVYLGSALMVYNIYCFASYARRLQEKEDWGKERTLLYVPILLLVLFLLGYLAVGLFGNPDMVIAVILFGGSVFVYIIFRFLQLITHRIQANERLEAELMAAEESNRAKTSFLSSMSHEMRTPMNAIVGLDTIALKSSDLTTEMRDYLEKIGIAARHLQGLIDSILDLSSVESEQLILRREEFSLRAVLDEVDVSTRLQCAQKGLEYQCDVADDVYAEYLGDASRVRQVLLIILDNAVKFTPAPGSVRLAVEPASADTSPVEGEQFGIRFVVSDTGIGIDEDFLPRLFEPFSQEDATTTNRYGGGGLGLALAQQIVALMNGKIDVESTKGEGSTFVVTLGLEVSKSDVGVQDDASAEDLSAVTDVPADAPLADLSGRHMLVVDDIDVNAEIVADLLELEDVTTDRAENGQVAVDLFAQSPIGYYDAVLMDLRMPVMDGFESARTIRALDRPDARTVPIVALTANAYEDDKRRTLEAGMNTHLAKPVDADELYYTLGVLIECDANGAQTHEASKAGEA